MANAKNNFVSLLRNRAKKQPLPFLFICILLLTLPLGVIMILSGILSTPSAAVEAHAFFSRSQYTLDPDNEVRLLVSSKTHEISFVRMTVDFDPSQVQLRDNIVVNSVLGTNISTTSISEANQTGRVTIVAGVEPGKTPLLGTFEVAMLPLRATSQLVQTPIRINALDSQVVAYNSEQVSLMVTDSILLVSEDALTATVQPTAHPFISPTPTTSVAPKHLGSLFEIEAENGIMTLPMSTVTDSLASNSQYVMTPSRNGGSDTFRFQVTDPGKYIVWARVVSADSKSDSFTVTMDNRERALFETAQAGYSDNWQWAIVNKSDLISRGKWLLNKTLNPMVYKLSAGTHNLEFKGREPGTKLDKIIITNNLNFSPLE